MLTPITLAGQLALATLLGGLIGLEREGLKRPAGFRTHILVCVGATVAIHTNIQLLQTFAGNGPIDPARLGAQVISGLGFLGAGTIVKEGATVKGLTTAASLWVVGIIGLAVGSGQYLSAILSTVILYFILGAFQRIEGVFHNRLGTIVVKVATTDVEHLLDHLHLQLEIMHLNIKSMQKFIEHDGSGVVTYTFSHPKDITLNHIIQEFSKLNTVKGVGGEEAHF